MHLSREATTTIVDGNGVFRVITGVYHRRRLFHEAMSNNFKSIHGQIEKLSMTTILSTK